MSARDAILVTGGAGERDRLRVREVIPVLLASCTRANELLDWRAERSDLATIIEDAARSRR